jgi:hypothetical protein
VKKDGVLRYDVEKMNGKNGKKSKRRTVRDK